MIEDVPYASHKNEPKSPSITREPAQQSKVPLKDAAAGCLKCKKELETGEKTRNSHSDQCPRKVVAEIGPDWTKQVERRNRPSN